MGSIIGDRHNSILKRQVNNKIAKIQMDEDVLIILKGIPLDLLDSSVEPAYLEDIASNKLKYLFQGVYGRRKYLSYDEFLLLENLILEQYKCIYILENNLYMDIYPLEPVVQDKTKQGMLIHFTDTENEEDNREVGNIEEILALYDGVKEVRGELYGKYCDEGMGNQQNVISINLFDEPQQADFQILGADNVQDVYEIHNDVDYASLVKAVLREPEKITVRLTNYIGNKNLLSHYLQLMANLWSDTTRITLLAEPKLASSGYEHRDDYSEILQKYWGYNQFRSLLVYDMNCLENGEKKMVQVSQENIISHLVNEVEHCAKGAGCFRDIFVTAPTGAGKSVMFQIPAIYLAEKYNLFTIVISPLIGLMNDQIQGLELKNYTYAKTINSDISPIVKQEIMDKVAEGKCHMLYMSPETLLSRSAVEQLIGDRTIGMIIIDEAHIVTTWGKQFRPDYWYLGDHIDKLRKNQLNKKGRAFVIATFTATAIYHGIEDMYTETMDSLHMLDPIPYLGYIKRDDIDIVINKEKKEKNTRSEYELDKFEHLEGVVKRAILMDKKTLIYFPTIALIERFYEFLLAKHEIGHIVKYYGNLDKDKKRENYELFYHKEKLIMLATKAFGMGIDINDIELVVHFAPTGNVCDYVQEIGRAARRNDLRGEAYYSYNTRDFKHINRLHGLSMIRKYQLVEIIKKVHDLYQQNLWKRLHDPYTKKRNAMLLDAENFSYIFNNPVNDEDDNINKVKTALLLIQKDFESQFGFSPLVVRPIPMFSVGFFAIPESGQKILLQCYVGCLEEIEHEQHICRVFLSEIWERDYQNMSFPKFKYLLYSRSDDLPLAKECDMLPALCVSVVTSKDFVEKFAVIWQVLQQIIKEKILLKQYISMDDMMHELVAQCHIGKYKAQAICEVVLSSMDSYRRGFSRFTAPIVRQKPLLSGNMNYQFTRAVNNYFHWVTKGVQDIQEKICDSKLYLINDGCNQIKEYNIILGLLEAFDVLSFEMIGGANSQLYIYINQIQRLKNILYNPGAYKNRLLEIVAERHMISVKMLTYIYENDFSSEEIWDLIEDYFLGQIPQKVREACAIAER